MAFTLKIAEQTVFPPPSGGARVTLLDFSRDYERPSELNFSVQGNWQSPPWGADQRAQLYLDKDLVFDGFTDLPRPALRVGSGPEIKYTAYDRSRGMTMRPIVDTYQQAEIPLPAGTLTNAVSAFLPKVSGLLAGMGIGGYVQYSGGADQLQCGPVSVTQSVDAGMRQVAAAAHGCKVILYSDKDGHRYRMIALLASPLVDIALDVDRLEEWAIQQSLEGRAGAVAVMPEETWAHAAGTSLADLKPAWDRSKESEWTIAHAGTTVADDGQEDELSQVFRLWSFEEYAKQIGKESELTAIVEGRICIPPRRKIVPIVKVDWEKKTVLLKEPAIKALVYGVAGRKNPNIPGHSEAANVKLRYSNTGIVVIYKPLARVPEKGYAGPAYEAAPITCANELRITSPGAVDHAKYARQAFDIFSRPTVSGSVTLLGELPVDLWWLDRRINFKTESFGLTNYENLEAPLLGFKHEFERGGRTTLDFSTDRKEMMEGAPV